MRRSDRYESQVYTRHAKRTNSRRLGYAAARFDEAPEPAPREERTLDRSRKGVLQKLHDPDDPHMMHWGGLPDDGVITKVVRADGKTRAIVDEIHLIHRYRDVEAGTSGDEIGHYTFIFFKSGEPIGKIVKRFADNKLAKTYLKRLLTGKKRADRLDDDTRAELKARYGSRGMPQKRTVEAPKQSTAGVIPGRVDKVSPRRYMKPSEPRPENEGIEYTRAFLENLRSDPQNCNANEEHENLTGKVTGLRDPRERWSNGWIYLNNPPSGRVKEIIYDREKSVEIVSQILKTHFDQRGYQLIDAGWYLFSPAQMRKIKSGSIPKSASATNYSREGGNGFSSRTQNAEREYHKVEKFYENFGEIDFDKF